MNLNLPNSIKQVFDYAAIRERKHSRVLPPFSQSDITVGNRKQILSLKAEPTKSKS